MFRKYFILFFICIFTHIYWSQSVGINLDGSAPRAGTILDVKTDLSGFDSSFVVTTRGNVGIGTSSPSRLLEMQGANSTALIKSTSGAASLIIDGAAATGSNIYLNSSGATAWHIASIAADGSFRVYEGASSPIRLVMKNGRFGLGNNTSPLAKFHIHNDVSGADSAFVVTDQGRVGIGTSSATNHLEILSTTGNTNVKIEGGSGGAAIIKLMDSDAGVDSKRFDLISESGNFKLRAVNDDTSVKGERIVVNSDGNVGIGINAPLYKFHSFATIADASSLVGIHSEIDHDGTGNAFAFHGNMTNSSTSGIKYGIFINDDDQNRLGGSLYLGSDKGASAASIELGQGRSADGEAYIDLIGDQSNESDYGTRLWRSAGGESRIDHRGDQDFLIRTLPGNSSIGGNLIFQTDNTERMVIDSLGNIGIGTSIPNQVLDIRPVLFGNDQNGGIQLAATNGNWLSGLFLRSNGSGVPRIAIDINSNEALTISNPGGNIGIGTSDPQAQLDIRQTGTKDILTLYDNGSEVLTVMDGGNVGIGTTGAAAKLHVHSTDVNLAAQMQLSSNTTSNCASLNFKDQGSNHFWHVVSRSTDHSTSTEADLFHIFYTPDGTNFHKYLTFQPNDSLDATSGDAFFSGNVGFGTSTIEQRLEVNGTIRSNAQIISTGANSFRNIQGDYGAFHRNDGNAYYILLTDSGDQYGSFNALRPLAIDITNGTVRLASSTVIVNHTDRNLGLGTGAYGTSAQHVLSIGNGTAPSSSIANGVQLYAEDVSASSELRVRDEAGNVTTLSPHNFSLINNEKSDPMAWSFYSENNVVGQKINVDMFRLTRLIEEITGEKLIYKTNMQDKPIEEVSSSKNSYLQRIELLEQQNLQLLEKIVALEKALLNK